MKRGRPIGSSRYTERHRYILKVLFLYGLSRQRIATLMGMYGVPMTAAAVNGQIAMFGFRKTEMPRATRQRYLDELGKNRLDRAGSNTPLPDYFFKAVDT